MRRGVRVDGSGVERVPPTGGCDEVARWLKIILISWEAKRLDKALIWRLATKAFNGIRVKDDHMERQRHRADGGRWHDNVVSNKHSGNELKFNLANDFYLMHDVHGLSYVSDFIFKHLAKSF